MKNIGDSLIAHMFSKDFMSYNQLIANPGEFKIHDTIAIPEPRFCDISLETTEDRIIYYRKLLEDAHAYSPAQLNKSDLRLYDYLTFYLDNALNLGTHFFCIDPYEPSRGTHVKLPFFLMSYRLRTKDDIDNYLCLVSDVARILDQANTIVVERSKRGLYPNLAAIEAAIEKASVYAEEVSKNILATTFEKKLNSNKMPFVELSHTERTRYIERNRKAIDTVVIPAYRKVNRLLKDIAQNASYETTIANLPQFKEYCAVQFKAYGFDEPLDEIIRLLDESIQEFFSIVSLNDTVIEPDKLEQIVSTKLPKSPEKIIAYFSSKIGKDFPEIGKRPVSLEKISDEEAIACLPAYYLVAPIDNLSDNRIKYYPQSFPYSFLLGSTLAHESFPGHLYQNNYFGLTNPHPIDKLVGAIGFVEGYAKYSEYYAYRYMGLDEETSDKLHYSDLFQRALLARLDLGINYEKWKLEEIASYLSRWGSVFDPEMIFKAISSTPLNRALYGYAPIKLHRLLSTAKEQLSEAFNPIEFHAVLLENGALPFRILDTNITKWIDGKLRNPRYQDS